MNSPNLPVVPDGSRLTPGELQAVVFARAALGRRGYDEDEVRGFLQYVERELVQILNERSSLAEEVDRLRTQLSKGGPGVMAPEDAHFQAVRILSQAQQTADLYVADAERYTRELAHEARLHREAILTDAKGRAEHLLEDAHRRAAEVADAAVRSGPPAPVPADAPGTPVLAGAGAPAPSRLPEEERRRMEQEITYLRTYSDVYRTHLRSYLEALLRNVDEWEDSERSSLPPAPRRP
ncbi:MULTISPECIES: DivIVA domain-containing protein [Actinomadura]|uniref:Cell wall synthesis protein Wag31 n=1 Tax=Actinomadura litoris TaxID=2678616 RepID=A0A7K1LC24_9ACTN|nr:MULTISPECIES: DivIVA domain-containing protein [Actinomadura]MBT2213693.1 DivIVA domain-containing protein [Actinomadura sp. NEAU-AAG7]MUN41974.1 DivIVA domain-containing protein [Actinomadura litoris]